MKKIKKTLSNEFIRWRYSKEEQPELFRIGVRIGFGLMCIVAAIVIIYKQLFI